LLSAVCVASVIDVNDVDAPGAQSVVVRHPVTIEVSQTFGDRLRRSGRSEDIQRLLEGSQVAGRDKDSGRPAMPGDNDAVCVRSTLVTYSGSLSLAAPNGTVVMAPIKAGNPAD
jgi:hypothetical protein